MPAAKTDIESCRAARMSLDRQIEPKNVIPELEKHILVDGFRVVLDLQKSRGPYLVDAANGRRLLDMYGFFGSMPLGYNHPHFDEPAVQKELLEVARLKMANADMYSTHYARFVATFHRVMGLAPLERYFFIEGGALAVENALKAAMDWKVRKNMAAGRGERGTEILHFERAFHGRTGYTLSVTNTDPRKTQYFARFPWPRVPAPAIDFSLSEPERTRDVATREQAAEARIREIVQVKGIDIAAILIEPIQGEGGDNHFRAEWMQTLRRICDEHEMLLVLDEVQTGMGTTGRRWCCEHFDVVPDLIAFGKKSQVCGVMAGPRLDEVPNNVFRLSSRINSTWGGNLTDMVRSTHNLEVIERDNLIEHAATVGRQILEDLDELSATESILSNVRGRGLFIAFDLPDAKAREKFYEGLFDLGLLAIKCGERSIRFRPALDLPTEAAATAIGMVQEQCRRTKAGQGSGPTERPESKRELEGKTS